MLGIGDPAAKKHRHGVSTLCLQQQPVEPVKSAAGEATRSVPVPGMVVGVEVDPVKLYATSHQGGEGVGSAERARCPHAH